jgi:hypothetical protein
MDGMLLYRPLAKRWELALLAFKGVHSVVAASNNDHGVMQVGCVRTTV